MQLLRDLVVDGEGHDKRGDDQVRQRQWDHEEVGARLQVLLSEHGEHDENVADYGEEREDDEGKGPVVELRWEGVAFHLERACDVVGGNGKVEEI